MLDLTFPSLRKRSFAAPEFRGFQNRQYPVIAVWTTSKRIYSSAKDAAGRRVAPPHRVSSRRISPLPPIFLERFALLHRACAKPACRRHNSWRNETVAQKSPAQSEQNNPNLARRAPRPGFAVSFG